MLCPQMGCWASYLVLLKVMKNTFLLFCCSVIAMVNPVMAYSLVPMVGVDIEVHSNATKDDVNEIEDTIIKPYFGFSIADQTELFLIDMKVHLEQKRYKDKTYSDSEIPDIDAYLGWKVIPGRVLWSFEDSASRGLIDVAARSVPSNFQNVNVFSTGPDVLFSRTAIKAVAKLRYNDVTFSERDDDNTALAGSLFLERELNAYSRLGGVLYHQDTTYDSSLNDDYKLSQMYLLYDRDLPYGGLQINLGANSFSNRLNDRTEPYGLVSLRYSPGGSLSAGASYRARFSDPGANLATPALTTLENIQTGQIFSGLISGSTANPYQQDVFSLYLGYEMGKYSSSFNYYNETDEYFGAQEDRDLSGASIDFGIELFAGLDLSFIARRTDTEFATSLVNDTTDVMALKLNYELVRGLFLNVGFGSENRDSSDPSREYEDNIVFAGIGYRGEGRE